MDFPKTLTIEVTQEDIDAGVPNNATTCPIARASTRAAGCPAYAKKSELMVDCGRTVAFYNTPRAYKRFIDNFDNGRGVSPTRFRLKRYLR